MSEEEGDGEEVVLREHVLAYLHGDGTLAELEEWFYSWVFDFEPTGDGLLARVEIVLGEHTSGYGSEEEVRALLADACVG